jgi:hypothetical protein
MEGISGGLAVDLLAPYWKQFWVERPARGAGEVGIDFSAIVLDEGDGRTCRTCAFDEVLQATKNQRALMYRHRRLELVHLRVDNQEHPRIMEHAVPMSYHALMMKPQTITILLAVGWTIGFLVQLALGLASGYADIFPPQMLLGIALCFGAGLRERLNAQAGSWRRGARAGATMMLLLIGPYLILTAIILKPSPDAGGETWLTLLLEAPLWLGLTFGSGALFGVLGWRVGAR